MNSSMCRSPTRSDGPHSASSASNCSYSPGFINVMVCTTSLPMKPLESCADVWFVASSPSKQDAYSQLCLSAFPWRQPSRPRSMDRPIICTWGNSTRGAPQEPTRLLVTTDMGRNRRPLAGLYVPPSSSADEGKPKSLPRSGERETRSLARRGGRRVKRGGYFWTHERSPAEPRAAT